MNQIEAAEFQRQLLQWFDQHGRKNLPWQQPITPYRVWVSEIMLQQTQVATVIPYFQVFMARFPNVGSLAEAPLDDVLALWAGLGYYARARHLHRAAGIIQARPYFPDNMEELMQLPGIGRSTAGAILSIAFKQRAPILDGNVKRVLARHQAISGWPGERTVAHRLWQLSDQLTPTERVADYTQGIMDLGATVCTRSRPVCGLCPLNASCQAYLSHAVAQYPDSRKAKPLPVKNCFMLLVKNPRNQILLEKKPLAGIWGGLWSLPEFPGRNEATAWCDTQRLTVQKLKAGAQIRHTFSHYHLDFIPLRVETDDNPGQVADGNRLSWHPLDKIDALGLPAPIKKLLHSITEES